MEKIEQVARAIFKVSAPYHDDCCLHNPDFDACPCNETALVQARAAIEAMREPTRDMIDHGGMTVAILSVAGRIDQETKPTDSPASCIWDSMIDAALVTEPAV